MLLSLIQTVIDSLAFLIDAIVAALPTSPLSSTSFAIADKYLGYINYFLPIAEMVDLCAFWLVCIGGYYSYMLLARLVKLID